VNETDTIAEAFSRTAERYDHFAEDHPNQARMRRKVYAHLARFVPRGARVLELAAGTGTDAVYLAQHGYRVHATDIAPGMLARLRDKVARLELADRITVQECSFTALDRIAGPPFDAVFSDLGGLNCVANLSPIIDALPSVLRPGGVVTWVLMPPICLWELALVFTGRVRLALRRLARGGTRAHLEGLYFTVHYFAPREVVSAFGEDFELLAIEGLSVITPTAESKNLAKRHPRVYGALAWLDDRLAPRPPWWGWGDFFIITLRYRPRPTSAS
jgi:ubiquinone/menaquinone biosynthesis C-methylase UbiE